MDPDLKSRVCKRPGFLRRGFIVGCTGTVEVSYGHGWVRVDVLAGLLDEDWGDVAFRAECTSV